MSLSFAYGSKKSIQSFYNSNKARKTHILSSAGQGGLALLSSVHRVHPENDKKRSKIHISSLDTLLFACIFICLVILSSKSFS